MDITFSSNPAVLRIDDIHAMLSRVYWSPGISQNEIWKGIHNSALVVGAYAENGRQVGFLRVVSDKVRFAYLADVVIHEDFRHQGIGRGMVTYTLSHPDLADVYQWLLVTMDAHGVYEKCGFEVVKNPEKWMSIWKQRPQRDAFIG